MLSGKKMTRPPRPGLRRSQRSAERPLYVLPDDAQNTLVISVADLARVVFSTSLARELWPARTRWFSELSGELNPLVRAPKRARIFLAIEQHVPPTVKQRLSDFSLQLLSHNSSKSQEIGCSAGADAAPWLVLH